MSRTYSPSTQRRYGLARVCRMWEVARSTVYLTQARQTAPPPRAQKPGRNRGGAMRCSWRRSGRC